MPPSKYACRDNDKKLSRILRVSIAHESDDDPDTSYYGEYSDKPDPRFCIDRGANGDKKRGEFRYFNPSSNYDNEGMDNLVKYTEQDYARMEAYNNGQWWYIGVEAWAEVQLGSEVCQHVRSGGVWGIESDSDAAYITECQDNQLAQLRTELEQCGFTKRMIDEAFKVVKRP